MTDERIAIEVGNADGGPGRGLLVFFSSAVVILVGFIGLSDFSDPEAIDATSSGATVALPSPSTTPAPVAEIDRVLRTRAPSVKEIGADSWVSAGLPPGMTGIAAIGEFRRTITAIGGERTEDGYYSGLRLAGRSGFASWFAMGTVTSDEVIVERTEFSDHVLVVVARTRPSTAALRGELLVLHSIDGSTWTESRISDRNGLLEVEAIAIERDNLTVFGTESVRSTAPPADGLSEAARSLIATGFAVAAEFDGEIRLLGPFGMQLASYPGDPTANSRTTVEGFRGVVWSGPLGDAVTRHPNPFEDGVVDAVWADEFGDIHAQVVDGFQYHEYFSIGDGTWTLRLRQERSAAQGIGGVEDISLFFDRWSTTKRLLVIDEAKLYRLDFGLPGGELGEPSLGRAGVLVPIGTPFGDSAGADVVFDVQGRTVALDVSTARLSVTDTSGVVFAREMYNTEPSAVDMTNGRFQITLDDGSDMWIDLAQLAINRRALGVDALVLADSVLTSADLDTWSHIALPLEGVVTAGFVGSETYVVVREVVDGIASPVDSLFYLAGSDGSGG